ncbi:MAG: ABC transporter substrate-binding protein, partial [Oscillospiraceae bacterium]|nr:ABC transporter substrate-binding protein [Oscillospiraceae bacterium]
MRRIIACCILMALVLSGCGTTVPEEPAEARAGYQILTDCAGRQVEVPLEPARVAALDSFAGEVMVMVGAGARMVAAPNGVKSDYILQCIYPALPEVSAPMSDATINAESLLATAPDLVLLKSAMYQSEGERAKLDKLDIPYLVIGYESMEEQIYALDLIGEALGGTARQTAGEISGYYRETVALAASLRDQVRAQGPLRVYHAISEATRTDGAQTLGNDWLQCVGVENVSAGERVTAAERDYAASLEQIYTWDPDVIICNEADTVPYLRSSDKRAGLRAVRE